MKENSNKKLGPRTQGHIRNITTQRIFEVGKAVKDGPCPSYSH